MTIKTKVEENQSDEILAWYGPLSKKPIRLDWVSPNEKKKSILNLVISLSVIFISSYA